MARDLLTTIRAEIDARLGELQPLVDEYEELLSIDAELVRERAREHSSGTASALNRRRGPRAEAAPARRRGGGGQAQRGRRAARGAAGGAILAALEHGSHSVRELVVVTAMTDANIRANVRKLLDDGSVVKVSREGKTAYALPAAATD
jgi:hypothetical protein